MTAKYRKVVEVENVLSAREQVKWAKRKGKHIGALYIGPIPPFVPRESKEKKGMKRSYASPNAEHHSSLSLNCRTVALIRREDGVE